ncbi:DUF7529 family protein [Haloarchaeobius amylolyticus]|uniref:DUF7529 family protein n=1 Tax=Haloarchaeobius amylolyticus TaxID=1198296 RepID=UPI00227003E6|nr:hypothetical protein [Haloarchaeobius amylolyticus]
MATDPDEGSTDVADVVAAQRDDLLADATAIADEYREAGWTAHALEPTEVRPLTGDDTAEQHVGLEVVVPADQFEPVDAAVTAENAGFDASEVYSRRVESVALVIVAVADPATETAVVVPLHYDVAAAEPMLDTAQERGELLTHVRPADAPENDPDGGRVVTFAHDDPSLFVPGMGSLD